MKIIKQISATETWPLRHEVMWPDKPIDFIKLPNDAEGLHFGFFEEGVLVSVISLFVSENRGQFRKFATKRNLQGKGYGSKLLGFVIEESKRMKLSELWCDARTSAIGFYEKFGMRIDSEVFQKSGKDYVKMNLKLI
ncbi:MAG: GNAT family N-acetyltransferase [Spirosomataceae bacterium]